jgi:hypothetical protein
MSAMRRLPVLSIALTLGAVVTVALSLLALSGVFGPRITVSGLIAFDACNNRQPDDRCVGLSHSASGVAVEYRAVGWLPVSFTAHTDSAGQYRLDLPPGRYRAIIQGCKSWPSESPSPPQVVVASESPDSTYNWVISADGTCQVMGIGL